MTISSKKLLAILKRLQPAVSSSASIPVLEYVKLGNGSISATNLNLTITHALPEADKEMLLPFAEMLSICGAVDGDLAITATTITCGKDKFKIGIAEKVDAFPLLPEFKGEKQNVNPSFFDALINAEKARSKEAPGLWKEYVCIDFIAGCIVGTDAQIMFKESLPISGKSQAIISSDFIKACAGFTDAELQYNEKFVSATCDGMQCVCTLFDGGKYANYAAVIPDVQPNVTFDKHALIRAIRKLQVYKAIVPKATIQLNGNIASLCFVNNDFQQEVVTEIECENNSECAQISLNYQLLLTLLSCLSNDIVRMNIVSETKAVTILENEKTLIIVPMMA